MDTSKNDLPDPFVEDEPEEGGGDIVGNCIAIPPGIYEVRYLYYATSYFINNAKVTLYFAVIEPDKHASITLERFYNVDSLKEPPKRYGGFRAKARGDMNREITLLLGPQSRLDRYGLAGLRDQRIVCEVATVKVDREKRCLPKHQQYSRIKRLIEILSEEW